MKWLLIANRGNPGDEWARIGVQRLIRAADSRAELCIRERDYRAGDQYNGLTEPTKPLPFDYSVICGMPLVWSHREPDGTVSSTTQHASWIPLCGWCSAGRRMIVAGFGIFLMAPSGPESYTMVDQGLPRTIQDTLFRRCRGVFARSPLALKFFPNVEVMPCPSVVAVSPPLVRQKLKLCNFMPGGSHYPQVCPAAARAMDEQMPELARQLIEAGYIFVAHRRSEVELALKLGWEFRNLVEWKGHSVELLTIYSNCEKYFGNRIHGGIVARAAGANVLVVGYDTRTADVEYLGGEICTPYTIPDLGPWLKRPAVTPVNREDIFEKQLEFFKRAMAESK